MTEFEQLDEILRGRADGELPFVASGTTDLYRQAIYRAVAYELLIKRSNTYDLTERGYEVLDAGGFAAWQTQQKAREEALHQAAIDSAKATVDAATSAKWSKVASFVSAVAAVIAFSLPPLLEKKPEATPKADSTLNVLRTRGDSLHRRLTTIDAKNR